jgi:hypothetical protein
MGEFNGSYPPEETMFPACLRCLLEHAGDYRYAGPPDEEHRWHRGYVYAMGASGAAFRLVWEDGAWDACITSTFFMADDALAPIRRAFAAIGYGFDAAFRTEFAERIGLDGPVCDVEGWYRGRIAAALKAGHPAIGIGVVGPPEATIVSGYDDGGEVLIGWDHFQHDAEFAAGLEFEPNGQYRKRDWFADCHGLIAVTGPTARAEQREIDRGALSWALDVMRTPTARGRHSGHAAYVAWAKALMNDENFAGDDIAMLRERYLMHFLSALVVAEGRHYGNCFLRNMAERAPEAAEPLCAAAQCFSAEHDLMWAVWEFAGGNGFSDEHARKLANGMVRRRITPLIELAAEKDEQAAGHIDRALALMG